MCNVYDAEAPNLHAMEEVMCSVLLCAEFNTEDKQQSGSPSTVVNWSGRFKETVDKQHES